jgi:hypothetical protein
MKRLILITQNPKYPLLAGLLVVPASWLLLQIIFWTTDSAVNGGLGLKGGPLRWNEAAFLGISALILNIAAIVISAHALKKARRMQKTNNRSFAVVLCAASLGVSLYPFVAKILGIPLLLFYAPAT